MTIPGAGGQVPPRPDQVYQGGGGAVVAPGTAQVFFGRLVVVFGPSGVPVGLFVYATGTTPALGNPPIFWATSSSADPYGNVIPSTAGVAGTGAFEAGNTIINPNGIFTYSALPPALGGLLTSSGVTTAGTDSAGNAYLPGNTTYTSGAYALAVQMTAGLMNIWVAGTLAGPWSNITYIGASQNDSGAHFGAIGGAFLTFDTTIYARARVAGSGQEQWNDMRPLSNSFVGTIAGKYPPQYRYDPDGYVSVCGNVQFPPSGGPNFNSVVFATLPSQYRPANNDGHFWTVTLGTNVTPVGTPNVQIDTGGNLSFHNCPASGMTNNISCITGRYPLNGPIAF